MFLPPSIQSRESGRTGFRSASWVRVARVRYLNLNPGFAVAWANLRHAVEALAASETTSQIKTAI